MSALDLRLLGRLGGAGLLAGAVTQFALMAIPRWETDGPWTAIVAAAAALGGLIALRACWHEDSTLGAVALTAGSYVALGVTGLTGLSQAAVGPLFVVVAAWCGLALGPTYALRLSPLALLCATLPAWVGRPGTALTAIGSIAVATLTGEIFARLADKVRRDASRDAHRTRALETLTAGQLRLAQAHDPSDAAAIASEVACDMLDAERTAILLERDGDRVVLGRFPLLESYDACDWQPLTGPDEHAFALPMRGRDGTGVRGFLTAQPRPGARLDPFGEALVASLAAATCAALESIALNRRLRVRAEVDPLTGLGNRRRLETALKRLHPGDVVMVLDLDQFKAVNDALGHDMGDRVLRAFGAHLSSQTRAGELAIRTGGEEFVVIAEAGDQARSAAAMLSRLATTWWQQSPLTTFSAGAAIHDGADPMATMKLADLALYQAKSQGRASGWLVTADSPRPGTQEQVEQTGHLVPFPGQPFRRREMPAELVIRQAETAEMGAGVS